MTQWPKQGCQKLPLLVLFSFLVSAHLVTAQGRQRLQDSSSGTYWAMQAGAALIGGVQVNGIFCDRECGPAASARQWNHHASWFSIDGQSSRSFDDHGDHYYSGMLHSPGADESYDDLRQQLFAGIHLV